MMFASAQQPTNTTGTAEHTEGEAGGTKSETLLQFY